MILTETVFIKPHGTQIKYLKDRGYVFSPNEKIEVRVEDLSPQSKTKIHIACDLCGAEKDETLCQYNKMVSRGGYYACIKCRQQKVINTNRERYGSNTPFASEEVWSKALSTMKEKYGYEYAMQSPELLKKAQITNEKRYGSKSPMQNEIIKQKVGDTIEKLYGYRNISQNPDNKKKIKEIMVQRYGVSCPLLLPSSREKTTVTNYENGTIYTSRQQKYICELYNGILNYPIGYYNVDILLPNTNIIIEYNGGGHDLDVKLGSTTPEEFRRRELKRYYYLKAQNYKQIIITSRNDYIPQDDILINMLNNAISLLSIKENNWVEYDIDKGIIKYSNNKNGDVYDYNKLRKIQKEVS